MMIRSIFLRLLTYVVNIILLTLIFLVPAIPGLIVMLLIQPTTHTPIEVSLCILIMAILYLVIIEGIFEMLSIYLQEKGD